MVDIGPMTRSVCLGLSVLAGLVAGCGSVSTQSSMGADAAAVDAGSATPDVVAADAPVADDTGSTTLGADVPAGSAALVAARPYGLRVPPSYDGTRAVPLVVLLHGYGATGIAQAFYFGLPNLASREGFLLAHPDGTLDDAGRRFWRASRACCDFANAGGDDVAYLNAVLDDVSARYRVDPDRVFLVGHSNGGFMAHRMACAASPRIAAVVSLAGATGVDDDYPCAPTSPVSVLQIHGTEDATVRFTGGAFPLGPTSAYPGARASVERWRVLSSCGAFADVAPTLDLDSAVAGPETTVLRAGGCMRGGVELWTMQGSGHIPGLTAEFGAQMWSFLQAHPRRP